MVGPSEMFAPGPFVVSAAGAFVSALLDVSVAFV